jgi:quinol monooxygenase YgiN
MLFRTTKGRTEMYASLRTYRIGSGSVDAVMRRVDRDFAEALSQEPGFVAYHAIDTGNEMVMTISLFHDREQAEASNELAAQWVAEELSDFNVTRVGVIGGEAMVSRASAEVLEPAHP